MSKEVQDLTMRAGKVVEQWLDGAMPEGVGYVLITTVSAEGGSNIGVTSNIHDEQVIALLRDIAKDISLDMITHLAVPKDA